MFQRRLQALVESDPDDPEVTLLLSPGVGLFRPSLPRGAFVTPDTQLGTFRRLQRFYQLVVPSQARGAVLEQLVRDGVNEVQFRTPLLRLGTAIAEQLLSSVSRQEASAGAAVGEIVVRSPTDGIFYRRSDPEAPPYVEIGAVIAPGARLGLVEVMKCFNQVRLEGDGLPQRCEVTAVSAADGAEVAVGQVLFVLRGV